MDYKYLVYLVLDELKVVSDDANFNEEHVIALLDYYRAYLLKNTYINKHTSIPDSNYQTICIDLEETPEIAGEPCEGKTYLKSVQPIPDTINVGTLSIYPIDYYQGHLTFVSKERMRFVGHNKYLQNIIYASLGPDKHLYLTSSNPQFMYLEKARVTGIFEKAEEAAKLSCNQDSTEACDILDKDFPIETSLVPSLIELVVKELSMALYRPKDETNNAKDDVSGLAVKQ